MFINIINKPEQEPKPRRSRTIQEMRKEGCLFKFWDGIDDPTLAVHIRINRSHKKIVQWAKDKGLEMVCIAEDDIKWCDRGAWQHFLDNIPCDFDIYLGGISQAMTPPDTEGRLTDWAGMHLYIVHSRFYDRFLSSNDDIDIDRSMSAREHRAKMIENKCRQKGHIKWADAISKKHFGVFKMCLPMAAIQYNGHSYHIGREINYDHYFRVFPQYKSVDMMS